MAGTGNRSTVSWSIAFAKAQSARAGARRSSRDGRTLLWTRVRLGTLAIAPNVQPPTMIPRPLCWKIVLWLGFSDDMANGSITDCFPSIQKKSNSHT